MVAQHDERHQELPHTKDLSPGELRCRQRAHPFHTKRAAIPIARALTYTDTYTERERQRKREHKAYMERWVDVAARHVRHEDVSHGRENDGREAGQERGGVGQQWGCAQGARAPVNRTVLHGTRTEVHYHKPAQPSWVPLV